MTTWQRKLLSAYGRHLQANKGDNEGRNVHRIGGRLEPSEFVPRESTGTMVGNKVRHVGWGSSHEKSSQFRKIYHNISVSVKGRPWKVGVWAELKETTNRGERDGSSSSTAKYWRFITSGQLATAKAKHLGQLFLIPSPYFQTSLFLLFIF